MSEWATGLSEHQLPAPRRWISSSTATYGTKPRDDRRSMRLKNRVSVVSVLITDLTSVKIAKCGQLTAIPSISTAVQSLLPILWDFQVY